MEVEGAGTAVREVRFQAESNASERHLIPGDLMLVEEHRFEAFLADAEIGIDQ
jgi:hypothetical protein